jgi:hypothetical protein
MTPINESTLILPARIIAELESRASARGCKPKELVREALDAAISSQDPLVYARKMAQRAKSIGDALAEGEPDHWPQELNDCLVVSELLGMMLEKWAEAYLMEMDTELMDEVEFICQRKGLSYEDFITSVIENRHPHLSHLSVDLSEEDNEDQDDEEEAGEEWKAL